jgi:hypothetical protein
VGTVGFVLLNNTHNGPQSYTITVASGAASASYSVTEVGSGDSEVYREVYALYEQPLGRDPDSAGFAFWTGSGGAGLGPMADSLLTSPEDFNSDFAVMAAYQAATGAPPTYAQFTAAVTSVRTGAQTVGGLFNSLIGSSFTATTLYQNMLNRAPTAGDSTCINTDLSACLQPIIGYPSSTTPVRAANNEFQSTGTYNTTLAADHTNGLYVQMIYLRDPEQGPGLGRTSLLDRHRQQRRSGHSVPGIGGLRYSDPDPGTWHAGPRLHWEPGVPGPVCQLAGAGRFCQSATESGTISVNIGSHCSGRVCAFKWIARFAGVFLSSYRTRQFDTDERCPC